MKGWAANDHDLSNVEVAVHQRVLRPLPYCAQVPAPATAAQSQMTVQSLSPHPQKMAARPNLQYIGGRFQQIQ